MPVFDKDKLKKPPSATAEATNILLGVSPIEKERNLEIKKDGKIERKGVSFDLRVDLHKKFKALAITEDARLYELIEEAMEMLLEDRIRRNGHERG